MGASSQTGKTRHTGYYLIVLVCVVFSVTVNNIRSSVISVAVATIRSHEESSTRGLTKQETRERSQSNSSSLVMPNTSSWKSMRVAIYMTTHQSKQHIDFLNNCWTFSVAQNELLQHADLIYFTSDEPIPIIYELGFRSVIVKRYEEVVVNSTNSTFAERDNAKQQGAIRAMRDPARYGYFDNYDWIMRLNPDVLLREDSYFRQQMLNESIDAIFKDYSYYDPKNSRRNSYKLHTDFYMFRPRIYRAEKVLDEQLCAPRPGKYANAEELMFCWFNDTFFNQRWIDIPGSERRGMMARIRGDFSPVVHDHGILNHCPNFLDAYNGKRPTVFQHR